jgi:hypothetical protein
MRKPTRAGNSQQVVAACMVDDATLFAADSANGFVRGELAVCAFILDCLVRDCDV